MRGDLKRADEVRAGDRLALAGGDARVASVTRLTALGVTVTTPAGQLVFDLDLVGLLVALPDGSGTRTVTRRADEPVTVRSDA